MLSKHFKARENIIGRTVLTGGVSEKNKVESKSFSETRAVSDDDWKKHFDGEVGLGLSPIMENNKCRWAAIDVDIYPIDIKALSEKYSSLPILFCRTKSGGLHIYVFFKAQQKSKNVYLWMEELSYLLGFPGSEIFPKQYDIPPTKKANWINLPYFNGDKTDRYCIYKGEKQTLQQFAALIEMASITDFNKEILEQFTLSGAPPSIQKMFGEGVERGTRDIAMLNVGVFLKRKYEDDYVQKLLEVNETINEPLDEEYIEKHIVSQLEKDNMFYQCKTELKGWCDKETCLLREFGCGSKHNFTTSLEEIIKIETVPPIWNVRINGSLLQGLSTDDLVDQNRIRKLNMEQNNILIPKVAQVKYEKLLNEKLEDVTIQPAPEDADAETGEAFTQIQAFCITRQHTEKIDQIALGKVYIVEGKNWFLVDKLQEWLMRKKCSVRRNTLYEYIRRLGGGSGKKYIGRVNANGNKTQTCLWWLPLYDEQLGESKLETPDFENIKDKENTFLD